VLETAAVEHNDLVHVLQTHLHLGRIERNPPIVDQQGQLFRLTQHLERVVLGLTGHGDTQLTWATDAFDVVRNDDAKVDLGRQSG